MFRFSPPRPVSMIGDYYCEPPFPDIMQMLTMYPLLREKRMLRLMKAASDWKATWVRCLLAGLMLQNRRRGMKASLARERRKVARLPALEGPGHLVRPAMVLPSRSHRLKMKKPPTGTKYFCQPWPEK